MIPLNSSFKSDSVQCCIQIKVHEEGPTRHKAERAFGYKESCTDWLSDFFFKEIIISNLYTSHLLLSTNEMPWFEEGVLSSFS